MTDFNQRTIAEFRANKGNVDSKLGGASLLLLHTTGAKSGEERVNPVLYQDLDGSYAVFATYAGAKNNPAWFHNLAANPDVTVEVGDETLEMTARVAESTEREAIWARQIADNPGFADYESKTDRVIPVVILERRF